MINFEMSVKIQRIKWIKRLLYGEKNLGWKLFFDHCLQFVGGRFIFLWDYELKRIKLVLDILPCYMEMLQVWQETSNLRYLEGYIHPIIFNNRNICINGKSIFDRYVFERGIVQLNHLVEKGYVKSVKYFMNLGMKGNNLLMSIDFYDSIPRLWKDDSGLIQFLEVDLISFNTYFHISSKKYSLWMWVQEQFMIILSKHGNKRMICR